MKLLIDNQLPVCLAVHFRNHDHECAHVIDLGLEEATDIELWERCEREGWILVSKDEDFVFLANRPRDKGRLIWVRLGNCRNSALLEAFERVHDALVLAVESGQRVIEIH